MYRDFSNYKMFNEVVFLNPNNKSLDEISICPSGVFGQQTTKIQRDTFRNPAEADFHVGIFTQWQIRTPKKPAATI